MRSRFELLLESAGSFCVEVSGIGVTWNVLGVV